MRFLYNRLAGYFPQLDETEVRALEERSLRAVASARAARGACARRSKDRLSAGRVAGQSSLRRRKRVMDEGQSFTLAEAHEIVRPEALTHGDIQQKLLDIGRVLGYYAETEFDYYDVVWRASESVRD